MESGVDDWGGAQWATFSPRTTRYREIVEKTRPSSIIQLIKEGKNPALRVDITRMEYVDVQKRGPPIRYGCPPHEDGEADVPSITTVYVVYMDERNNTIMEGSSAEYGGGLHYGNGTSGQLKRRQHGHLTIPSGSTYIFPGNIIQIFPGNIIRIFLAFSRVFRGTLGGPIEKARHHQVSVLLLKTPCGEVLIATRMHCQVVFCRLLEYGR